MIYHYQITSGPRAGEIIEIEHKMTEPAFTTYVLSDGEHEVKRVIAPTTFILKGGNWARDGYTHATQPLTKEDRANLMKKP